MCEAADDPVECVKENYFKVSMMSILGDSGFGEPTSPLDPMTLKDQVLLVKGRSLGIKNFTFFEHTKDLELKDFDIINQNDEKRSFTMVSTWFSPLMRITGQFTKDDRKGNLNLRASKWRILQK